MTYTEAREILTEHNRWRRDDDGRHEMQDPAEIGEAIDVAVDALDTLEKAAQFDAIFCAARRNPAYYAPGRSRRLARHSARAQAGRTWNIRGMTGADFFPRIKEKCWVNDDCTDQVHAMLVVRRPARQKVRAR